MQRRLEKNYKKGRRKYKVPPKVKLLGAFQYFQNTVFFLPFYNSIPAAFLSIKGKDAVTISMLYHLALLVFYHAAFRQAYFANSATGR